MPPRRPKRPDTTGADLRAFLTEQEREIYGVVDYLFGTAAAIERGDRLTLYRFELPNWCAKRNRSAANDVLVLDGHNALIDGPRGPAR